MAFAKFLGPDVTFYDIQRKEEIIAPFLKLYKLAKRKGMGVKQVVDVLATANNDLPALEEQFNRLRSDIGMLQF